MNVLLSIILAILCWVVIVNAQGCNLLKNTGLSSTTKRPQADDILTDFSLTFAQASGTIRVPHCENCIWTVSLYESDIIGSELLAVNGQYHGDLTSLPSSLTPSSPGFTDVFQTGTSFTSQATPYWGDSRYFTSQPDGCRLAIRLKSWTPETMTQMALGGNKIFRKRLNGTYLELLGVIYVNAIYPLNPNDPSEGYTIYRFPLRLTFVYKLVASLASDIDSITQRELLVSVNQDSELEVIVHIAPTPQYRFLTDACVLDSGVSTIGGLQIFDENSNGDKFLTFTSSTLGANRLYSGTIGFRCRMRRSAGNGQDTFDASFSVDVQIGPLQEITRDTSLGLTGAVYTGTHDNPFAQPMNGPLTSGSQYIGYKISASSIPNSASLILKHLQLNIPDVVNSNIVSDGQRFANNPFGARVYGGSDGLRSNEVGFGFNVGSMLGMRASSVFVYAIVRVDLNLASRDVSEKTESEEATINTRIDLFEAALKGATSHSSSTSGDKLVAILIPSIAGGICLLCMFGIVALVGLILLGSIIRKGVQAKGHSHLDEDASIPSDSDVDLRNHAV